MLNVIREQAIRGLYRSTDPSIVYIYFFTSDFYVTPNKQFLKDGLTAYEIDPKV